MKWSGRRRNMTKSQCNVCEGVLGPARFPGLLRCRSCSFVTADLSLSDAQLRDLYTEKYFVGQEYSNYRADRQVIQKNFRARMKVLSPYIEKAEEKRLFEIGCAYGFFLDIAKSQFF